MLNRDMFFWVTLSRVVNSIVTLYGVGIILYCLWFLKTWHEKTDGLPFSTPPLFILVCLAIGIALCLGTACGYAVANCFSDCMLSIYIGVMFCLLVLEIAVVVIIFITMNWAAITAIALAISLLALDTQAVRSGGGNPSVIPDFRQSFLVLPSSRVHEDSPHQL